MRALRHSCPLAALLGLAALGCGSSDSSPNATAATEPPAAPSSASVKPSHHARPARRRGTVVRVSSSPYGSILADRRGQAVYLFTRDRSRRSRCAGSCARAWPPLLTRGRPRPGRGARAARLGTTRRRDGRRQVTYRGHPLYYYWRDAPGRILCQNVPEFGGTWLVVRPSGSAVR